MKTEGARYGDTAQGGDNGLLGPHARERNAEKRKVAHEIENQGED